MLAGFLVFTGIVLAESTKLELWTFVDTHADWFTYISEQYKHEVNPNVEIEVMTMPGLDQYADRLMLALAMGEGPDLVDLEQGWFGNFLTLDPVPFVDLRPLLERGVISTI